jgi:hypothetical protein
MITVCSTVYFLQVFIYNFLIMSFYAVFILDEPSAFYAEEIYDAVSGEGTNDRKLIQIFLKRSEVPAKYAASRF